MKQISHAKRLLASFIGLGISLTACQSAAEVKMQQKRLDSLKAVSLDDFKDLCHEMDSVVMTTIFAFDSILENGAPFLSMSEEQQWQTKNLMIDIREMDHLRRKQAILEEKHPNLDFYLDEIGLLTVSEKKQDGFWAKKPPIIHKQAFLDF